MTSPHDRANTPEGPGGVLAAGASPQGGAGATSARSSAQEAPVPSTLHDLEDAVHQLEADAEHRPPAAGTTTNLVVATLVVALGAAALVGSRSLDIGTMRTPGPGTWPMILSLLLVALGLGLAATARRTTDAERFSRSSLLVLVGLATMVVFVALIGTIGFEIPAALLAFVWLRFLGGESWRLSVITSLGLVVAFYLIFVAALSVPIPHLF